MKNYAFLRCRLALTLVASLLAVGLSACTKDLDREPFYDLNTERLYQDPANYIRVLAKCYASFNLGGQTTTGNPDVFIGQGKDEGETSYLRAYWYLQELVTDEAVVAWNNGPLQELNKTSWTAGNDLINNSYTRIFYVVALCNDFIRETSDEKLAGRSIGGADAAKIRTYRAEARFLRALAYSHALDLYGNVPFTTEADAIGQGGLPRQTTRPALFAYLTKELREMQPGLLAAHQAPYGRADRGAAWALTAKLYLNAPVYAPAQTAPHDSCLNYCNKLVASNSNYALAPDYAQLFMADNNVTSASEIIFPITSDGNFSQTYGGTTYLVHAAVGGRMLNTAFGIDFGWAGNRTRKTLPQLFVPDPSGLTDNRAMFFTRGQNLEINDLTQFNEGYGVTKWTNKTSTGANGNDPKNIFVDTDFPVFRLADVYLMYAEAVLRGGRGGSPAQALLYVNALRDRAFGNVGGATDGNITASELTTDFILDERARELYWEGSRRTDLIRFGKFGGSTTYVWPWKGGARDGRSIAPTRDLYPLPTIDLLTNTMLVQNPGY